MAFSRSVPSQTVGSANAVTTSTDSAFDFGFNATYIRVTLSLTTRM